MGAFILAALQLLAVLCLTATQPTHDYWGEFGADGPCSRTCGTGVTTRTRTCITSRTDGGHSCQGSSKSFRTCNTQECPAGSRDFREEQCSQFDAEEFLGRRRTWVPYYGASNPCELNCVPRGENIYYQLRPAVVDGTLCYLCQRSICVDGFCRRLHNGQFIGSDEDNHSVHSAATVVTRPSETHTYIYKTGVYGECSASCNGGVQYRSMECWVQDPVSPRVVEETHCITQRLQRPHSQQACNMQPCDAEYRVSGFSECSVTCGEGQQSREVTCVGPRGENLGDYSCGRLARPPSAQACHRPACHTHVTWHVTDYDPCTRSCGGGVRERRFGCFDTDRNPYPEAQCGSASRPAAVEECNTQACPETRSSGSQTNTAYEFYPSVVGHHCAQSSYGCCPDGHTSATGPWNQGCPREDCVLSRFGCCSDRVTPARGFGGAGCPEYQTPVERPLSPPAAPSPGNVCSLPRDEGTCGTWMNRFYYDLGSGECTVFWYGGCQGNANNFISLEECQRECGPDTRRMAPRRATRST